MDSNETALDQGSQSHSMASSGTEDSYYAIPSRFSQGSDVPKNVPSPGWLNLDESSSDDEDEVLWTGNEFDSDDDFVLVPHVPATARAATSYYDEAAREVIQGIARLSLSQSDKDSSSMATEPRGIMTEANKMVKGGKFHARNSRPKKHTKATSLLAPPPLVNNTMQQSEQVNVKAKGSRHRKGRKVRLAAKKATGNPNKDLGSLSTARPIKTPSAKVIFENTEHRFGSPLLVESDTEVDPKYEGAVSFITSFLKTSAATLDTSQHTRLTFLQSLIIELGLMSSNSTLPSSLSAATRFLKANAFLNVKDYLSVRHEGFGKLQQIMFKNKRELALDLRKNRGFRQVDRTWVKEHGLNVFLIKT